MGCLKAVCCCVPFVPPLGVSELCPAELFEKCRVEKPGFELVPPIAEAVLGAIPFVPLVDVSGLCPTELLEKCRAEKLGFELVPGTCNDEPDDWPPDGFENRDAPDWPCALIEGCEVPCEWLIDGECGTLVERDMPPPP